MSTVNVVTKVKIIYVFFGYFFIPRITDIRLIAIISSNKIVKIKLDIFSSLLSSIRRKQST